MTTFTDYLEEKLLDHVFRATSYTSPSAVYLGLFTAAPTDSTSGTEVSAANGYSRQSLTFGAYSQGKIATSADVTFTASGGSWGVVLAFGIFDASSGGNLLASGTISPSVLINDTDTFTVASGKLEVRLD